MRFRLSPVAFSLLCAFAPPACADGNDALPLHLDRSLVGVSGSRTAGNSDESPIFISAQQMEGKKDAQIDATGNVELRRPGQKIYANHLIYLQDTKDVSAQGAVRIEQDDITVQGPSLKLNLDTDIGDMTKPAFQIGDIHARGTADKLHLNGRKNYVLHDVVYTTCPADQDDWLLKVRELEIDRNTQVGTAHSAHMEFMGVPILYTPWMDFALNDQRKSGFLSPVFGSTVNGGSDLTIPYYWNIAPNLDATLAPRIMTKRGVLLNNEMRYMGATYSGEAHVDVLPGDRLANRTRSELSLKHAQNFGNGLNGSLNLNRVSDDAYFRDLSSTVSDTSQTNLLRQGILSYSGGWWSTAARVQSFQTLQDPAKRIVAPYKRLPQITVGAQRTLGKADLSLTGEFVDFSHPTLINGQRLVFYPSVSYPLVAQPAFYLTPKFGLHNTYYAMGTNNPGRKPNASRTVPIFSLDSGVTMERDWSAAGQNFVQTLEPRAYYVHIPYRKQDQLPNFDSAQADFSFAQIFTENRFFGNDRIGDADQVTLGLTSRLLEPDSGAERLRVTIAQRFSTITPRVNLVTPTATTNKSDILLGATGRLTRAWSLDSTLQYNPNQTHTEKFNASARYQPEIGKVINFGYRFTRKSLRQMDLSSQWPIAGHWRGVARWNYSFQDKRLLEALGGLEYNQSCWTVRFVAQRFATATRQVSTGFFVQLELNDMVAIGADPLDLLGQSIPGYAKLNTPYSDQSAQNLP